MRDRSWTQKTRRIGIMAVFFIVSQFPLQAGAGGIFEGQIVYRGNPPKPKQFGIVQDSQVCGTSQYTKEFLVHEGHGIQNVVVTIEHLKELRTAPFEQSIMTIRGCEFWPYITLVSTTGTLNVINGDSISHQISTQSLRDPPINTHMTAALTEKTPVKTLRIRFPEILKLQVAFRPWMTGYLYVTDLPYTVVTDGEGRFKIVDVPEGRYLIKAWHEKLGYLYKRVRIKEGEVSSLKWVVGHNIN